MRQSILSFLILGAAVMRAQSTPTNMPAMTVDHVTLASRQMELFTRAVREANDDEALHTIETRNEQMARLQFQVKANEFVALWSDFAARLNDKQTFDVKLAKRLSKAFHELEKSDGWPVRLKN